MTGNPTRERKLLKQPLHALLVLWNVRIQLRVRAFQVGIGDHARATVPGTADEDGAQVVIVDNAIQVRVNEVQARSGSPMSEQPGLDVLQPQRLTEESVLV